MRFNELKKWIFLYFKGFAMGCADAVPGVSGGTIALITGIYERLITAVTSIGVEEVLQGLRALKDLSFTDMKELFLKVDGPFLLAVGFGIITAVISVLSFVHYTILNYPFLTYGFFFGLIAASALVMYRKIEFSSRKSLFAGFLGFLFAFMISGYASTALGNQLPVLFVAGMVSVSAMVLPGISGSLILIMLGQYEFMSAALSDFMSAVLSAPSSKSLAPFTEAAVPVVVFIFGAIVGLFAVAHSVRRALDAHRELTMVFLVSLIVGALRAPVGEVGREISSQGLSWAAILPGFASSAAVGALTIIVLDFYAEDSGDEI